VTNQIEQPVSSGFQRRQSGLLPAGDLNGISTPSPGTLTFKVTPLGVCYGTPTREAPEK
jgi:hypothetical protein